MSIAFFISTTQIEYYVNGRKEKEAKIISEGFFSEKGFTLILNQSIHIMRINDVGVRNKTSL